MDLWLRYATLGVALVSAIFAIMNFGVGRRRKRRDLEAMQPFADFTLTLTAVDECEARCRILNRGLRLLRLLIIAVEAEHWQFVTADGGSLFSPRPVDIVIDPGERWSGDYPLRAISSEVATSCVTLTLIFEMHLLGQDEQISRRGTRQNT